MMDWLQNINSILLDFLWGPYMLAFFLFTGTLFTLGTGFFQLRHIGLWFRFTFCSLLRREQQKKEGISQLQALCTTLAATVGTGNITGVATALVTGGPGAIFWMWVSAFFGMMTAFAENVLSTIYRRKDKAGNFVGGAMVYLEDGLHARPLAFLFSIFCVLVSLGMGNMTQMHSTASALENSFDIPPLLTGILFSVLLALVISGGIHRIGRFTVGMVPVMVILFLLGSGVCLYLQRERILPAFAWILHSAFSTQSVTGGIAGYTALKAIRTGFARGVFSNEAGLGTSGAVHAASATKEPVVQGMWGIFEVFVDTILVCTITALVILTSGLYIAEGGKTGVALTSAAYAVSLGKAGEYFISVSIVLFAFATTIGWSYLGERSFCYLFGPRSTPIYKGIYITAATLGAIGNMELIWGISDSFNAMLAIPNLTALLLLSGKVFDETKRFLNSPYRKE